MIDPVTYEQEARLFLEALQREAYLNGAGLKETLEISPIYQRHAHLFGAEVAAAAREWSANRRLRNLRTFAILGYLEERIKDLDEEITNASTAAKVEWDGEELPYRLAGTRLVNEPDPQRRHELERRIQAVTQRLNPRRRARWERLYQEADALGYPTYRALCEEIGELNLDALADALRQLLDATAPAYFPRLRAYLKQIGVPPNQATAADLQFLNRAPQFDPLFPREGLVGALEQLCHGLGLPLRELPNLHLDIEARPLKSPRAFCSPIRVPDEVMLVIMPKGGADDYRALYHEAGHALHFALTERDLPFALQLLGDSSVTECYAFLMDNLTHDADWLRAIPGVQDGAEYRALSHFHKTWMLRRYAAKLLYELELHAGADLDRMPERYARGLSEALGVEVRPVNYLSDVDDAYYAARYLRAWMLEVQLREHLRERFGPRWFRERGAGKVLRQLWRRGESFTAEELAGAIGGAGIDPAPLIRELTAA